MNLTFITGNQNKVKEVQALIPSITQKKLDLPETQDTDSQIIIQEKINEAKKHHSGNFIIEDTGLYLDALNGFPGPLIKWLLKSIKADGISQLANKLQNTAVTAKCTVGLHIDNQDHFFVGECRGRLVSPTGETSFGWDAIFLPDGYNETFAQMSLELKNSISHRRVAVEKLVKFLENK